MAVLPHEGTYSVMYRSLAVPVGSGYRDGYLARPDRAGRFPTVIIVSDLNGPSAHEKGLARRFARSGLATLVVDALPRSRADRLDTYHDVDDAEGVRVLDETHEYLSSDDLEWPIVERVGLVGLDVTGRFALIQAAHRPWVGALAVVETPLTGDEERRYPVADMLDHLAPPVLGLYGAQDTLIASDTVDEAQRRNPAGSWLLYQDTGHGFIDPNSDGYQASSAEDATARLIQFFVASLPSATEIQLG